MRSRQDGNRENATWYLALIIILAAGLILWITLTLRSNIYSELLKENDLVSMLFVIDQNEQPLLTELFLYNPQTRNAALVNIPEETGTLLTAIDRVDRLQVLYDPGSPQQYKDALGTLLGVDVDLMIRLNIDEFEHLVDIAGSLDIFIPNAINREIDGRLYLFPPGSTGFDGAKARLYVEYRPPGELPEERGEREHQIIQSLLRQLGDHGQKLVSTSLFPYVRSVIHGDLDDEALKSFITELSFIDTSRIIYQGILGNRRTLEGRIVLFPYYDGKLIKETVQRVTETLARTENTGQNPSVVRMEILNGTRINGLASRTAEIYKSYGYRISAIRNADNFDYEHTLVIDRRGNAGFTRQVADIIRCERIHTGIDSDKDETVDITVILGRDFDGRYVIQ